MSITREPVAHKLAVYLHHEISLGDLVDWAQNVDLLPILDDFERALQIEAPGSEPYRQGLEIIHRAMLDMLRKRARRILQPTLRHRPHQIQPPAWPIILIPRNHIRRTRLQAQAAMNTRQQLLFLSSQNGC